MAQAVAEAIALLPGNWRNAANARSWDDMGIVSQMMDAGVWLRGLRLIVQGSPVQDLSLDLSDLPYGQLGVPRYETERILTAHLGMFGIEPERPVTLLALHQDENSVHVSLSRPDGSQEEAAFRYVIGCDGAGSAVRLSLGIPFEGDHFPMSFIAIAKHLQDVADRLLPEKAPLTELRWSSVFRIGMRLARQYRE